MGLYWDFTIYGTLPYMGRVSNGNPPTRPKPLKVLGFPPPPLGAPSMASIGSVTVTLISQPHAFKKVVPCASARCFPALSELVGRGQSGDMWLWALIRNFLLRMLSKVYITHMCIRFNHNLPRGWWERVLLDLFVTKRIEPNKEVVNGCCQSTFQLSLTVTWLVVSDKGTESWSKRSEWNANTCSYYACCCVRLRFFLSRWRQFALAHRGGLMDHLWREPNKRSKTAVISGKCGRKGLMERFASFDVWPRLCLVDGSA